MFYIRSARRTVDSKIDKNRCNQKYEIIQVMFFIQVYHINCLKLQYYIDRYLPVSIEKMQCGIVLLFCIFETSVHLWGELTFFILCHSCISMGRIKKDDIV